MRRDQDSTMTKAISGRRAGPVVAHDVAEVVGAAGVAAFLDHVEDTTGGKGREFLQGLADEGEVGVDARGAQRQADAWQAGLTQNSFDAAMMQVQLPGNGADGPFLDVVVAQDLGFDFSAQGHGAVLSGRIEGDDEPVGAKMPYEPIALAADGKNGSATAATMRFLHTTLGSPAVEQVSPGVGNPDASLSRGQSGNAAGARRGRGDHGRSPDSAARLHVRNGHAPVPNTPRRSSADHGRSGCSRAPLCGSGRKGSVVPGGRSAGT